MQRVAVFGNAGGGKSTLARRLAEISGLPLYVLDIIQFRDGRYWPGEKDGGKISAEAYRQLHAGILAQDRWIIDGFESVALAWERFAAADTLIHVDLPIRDHYWGVTRRLAAGLLRNPRGWPENSPVWESSLDSYRVVGRCHRHLTPKYRAMVAEAAATKRVHHLTSRAAMRAFLQVVTEEVSSPSAAAPGGNRAGPASSPP
jgi:adenylate kinase family enzyme